MLFQSRRLDGESGLYYFRNRQYDPVHGRFLSRDPMGYIDSMNLYSFVNNNPMCYRDPDGKIAWFVVIGVVFIVAPPILTETAHFTEQDQLAEELANWSVVHNAAEIPHGRQLGSIEGLWNEEYSGVKLTGGDYAWNSVDVGLTLLPPIKVLRGGARLLGKADDVVRLTTKADDIARLATKSDDAVRMLNKADDAAKYVRRVDDIAEGGYDSFAAFKRVHGKAGKGYHWHHIVEQTPANIKRFGPRAIHNPRNIVRLPGGKGSIHVRISGLFSSKPLGMQRRVRDMLSSKSFREQFEYGLDILKSFGYK